MPYVHVLMYTETLHIAIKYHTVYIYTKTSKNSVMLEHLD